MVVGEGGGVKIRSRTILILLFMTSQAVSAFAGVQDKDIPRLRNPFSGSYLRENLKRSKPRMIYNEQIVERLEGKIKSDPVIKNLYEAIRIDAFEILDLPVMRRVKTTNAMLGISRELLRRVNMLGLVYLIEKDKIILERIDQELQAAALFSDWNPPVYLDVAEICMAVSLALDWTHDDLPESTIKLAKRALTEKGIYPSWEEYGGNKQDVWWIDHYNNWNQVCNGGMIAASIAIADDDPELAAKTIQRALSGIPHELFENYFPDGVCPEGVGYWDYATSYALLTASMLETAFGSDFGYKAYPGFLKSADFKMMCSRLPSGGYYNFADCGDAPETDGDILLAWFAAQTGKSMYYEKEKFLRPAKDLRLSYLTGAALSWMSKYRELSKARPPLVWVGRGRTPVAVFKGDGPNSDYYFAAKGGCGAVSHGNMDAGSFIFELNGVRWSVDPGTQDYLIGEQGFDLWRQCQECQRWELLTKNNYGHSTLTVNGERHKVDGYALVREFKPGQKPSVTFDLGPVFQGRLKSAFRRFTKDGERSLLVEDMIRPEETTKLVTWQFVTQADVEIVDGGALLKQNGRMLKLFHPSHPDKKFSIVSLDPPPHKLDKRLKNFKRIELRIPVLYQQTGGADVRIQIRMAGL